MSSQVEVRKDVVFGTGGGRDLLADVYSPGAITDAVPAILLLHGGGWRMGQRGMMEAWGHRFAEAGLVGVASEYRLHGEGVWPAHIHDTKAALRWMKANAGELGIDDQRIAILGRSAGGHLALLTAGTPGLAEYEGHGGNPGVDTSVAAAVGVFPPTAFFTGKARVHGATPARALLLDEVSDDAARLASPLAHVSPAYPPTFLLHGTDDKVVPPSASMTMYEALVGAGVPVELHMYARQPHGFVASPDFLDLTTGEVIHFLRRALDPTFEAAPDPALASVE